MAQVNPPLRPSPMRLGDVFSGTFEVFKRRFGLFLGLGALPVVAIMLIASVFGIVMFALFAVSLIPLFGLSGDIQFSDLYGMIGVIVAAVVLYLLMLLAIVLVQYRIQAMTVVAASDLAQGGNPTFGELGPRTKGFVGRFLVIALILVGAVGLVAILVMVSMFVSLSGGNSGTPSVAGGVTALAILFAAEIGGLYVSIRLWYLIPVIALEPYSGTRALARAWHLSRGSFWRIVGYAVVLGLAIGLPVIVLAGLMGVLVNPASGRYDETASVAASMLSSIITLAWSVLVIPFQMAFQTVMYLDQLRRGGEPLPAVPSLTTPFGGTAYPPYPQPPAQQYPTPPNQAPLGYPETAPQPGWQAYPPSTPQSFPPPASPPASPPRHAGPPAENTPGPNFEPPRHVQPPDVFGEPQPPSGNGRPPGT